MTASTPGPRTSAWAALETQARTLGQTSARHLYDADAARFSGFSLEAAGLLFDYSRHNIDATARSALIALAEAVGLRAAIEAMWAGAPINASENRSVLHVALRQAPGDGLGGAEREALVLQERARMLGFAEDVRTGRIAGEEGRRFELVINIGIGGSDLGPAMAVEALRNHTGGAPRVAFVSNVDGCALADLLEHADPRATLFIVASKTFTTQETMANARSARAWIVARLGEAALPAHFAAVSVNAAAMDEFGVHPDYRFAMWDWVGGRYSLWSSIGVSLAIAIGRANFEAFLAGGREIDQNFRSAPWLRNLPAMMGLVGVWNINFRALPTLAVLPYDSRLARFPAYLQQLEMESNGKSVTQGGARVEWATAPVVWGEPGNNAQHSFFQLLHQGTPRAALDFLLPLRSSCGNEAQQKLVIANCLAQMEALLRGQRGADLPPYRIYDGDRPSSLLLFERLDPATLGRLVATYEHKVFTQGVVWGVNSFDQWGVELGKSVANSVLAMLDDPAKASGAPASLAPLLARVRSGG
jgi:glucose-6-phosphate isomerase